VGVRRWRGAGEAEAGGPTESRRNGLLEVLFMADDRKTQVPMVRLIGRSHSSEAFELRDFLQRSVVAFDWVELVGDGDAERELGPSNLADVRLPVVELPGGDRLFAPSVR
jgi:thioredoxin reductase (NADPH)